VQFLLSSGMGGIAFPATESLSAPSHSCEFRTFSASAAAASSSHFDDAMIHNPGRRMTVAQLKNRMDARFNAADKRFDTIDKRFDAVDRHFDTLGDKLNEILTSLKRRYEHHDYVVDEHDRRITDLETWRLTTPDVAGSRRRTE
jgi:hypothetical protein